MKFGLRIPSLTKRLGARASPARFIRHSLGFKAPRGWGWFTNPRKAAYNRVYNRTTFGLGSGSSRSRAPGCSGPGGLLAFGVLVTLGFIASLPPLALAVLGVVGVAGLGIFVSAKRTAAAREAVEIASVAEQRRADLMARFGMEHAEAILAHRIWIGATAEMLRESLGPPASIDERVLKTKVKHTFKYEPMGRRRFALKVQLDDERVVSWTDSSIAGGARARNFDSGRLPEPSPQRQLPDRARAENRDEAVKTLEPASGEDEDGEEDGEDRAERSESPEVVHQIKCRRCRARNRGDAYKCHQCGAVIGLA